MGLDEARGPSLGSEHEAMPSAELMITLTPDMAELVEHKVRSGAYASASDVVREGLRALQERDAGLDRWLCEDVVAGHAEYLADPTTAVSAEDLLERVKRVKPNDAHRFACGFFLPPARNSKSRGSTTTSP